MVFRSRSAILLAAFGVAACGRAANVGTPTPETSLSYLVRLGADTVAVEHYARTRGHIDADIMQRAPVTYVAHSVIDLTANGLAASWSYDPRLVSGTRPPTTATRTLSFDADSVTVVSDTGAQFRRRVGGGPAVPNITNSMLTWQLAIDYARLHGGDSVNVPTVTANGARGTLPVRFVAKDSVRSYYGGPSWPVYITLDADGHITRFNGLATTIKTVAARIPPVDVRTLATAFTVRDQTTGPMGAPSTRDTVRAVIGNARLWLDYGRPSLRGRNPWVNAVLGDTLWRTGANAATQFRTDTDLSFGSQVVPAGTYTLWTRIFPGNSRYELLFNKQVGQWGTVHDPSLDLYRVPLTVTIVSPSAERFTMTVVPNGDGGTLAMQWGATRLDTPFTVGKK
jgi:hypothetical protein